MYIVKNYFSIFFIVAFFSLCAVAFSNDTTSQTLSSQTASGSGSNNSVISTEYFPRPSGSGAYYMNAGNNSSVIGNYLEGYYYDSVLGYFEFDWSNNKNENVRIVSSTDRCSTGYGYKLGGYSYSPSFGYIDFDYDDDIFVYYCESSQTLSGYAYSQFVGFQNFEGITFSITTQSTIIADDPTDDPDIVNDGSPLTQNVSGSLPIGDTPIQNSNFGPTTIQNSTFDFDITGESLFYIIK